MNFGRFFKRLGPDIVKDLMKKAFWWSVGLAGLWALAAISNLAGQPTPKNFSELWDILIVTPTKFRQGVIDSPIHFAVTFFFFSLCVALVVWTVRANRLLRHRGTLLKDAATYQALVEECGLDSRWPHAATDGTGAPWARLCADIQRNDNTFIYLLGANGIDTFSSSKAPLNGAISAFRGQIRAVLLDPRSSETDARASAVGQPAGEYKKAIRSSATFLDQMRKQSKPVEIRFYNGQPNWKIIVTSHLLWVQYYTPGGPDVSQTPVYIFRNNAHVGSFYNLFLTEFNRIWARCDIQRNAANGL